MQVASCNKCERHTQLALYANLHISNRVSAATKKNGRPALLLFAVVGQYAIRKERAMRATE